MKQQILQRIKSEIEESNNHSEMVGMVFGSLYNGTIHFVWTIKATDQVLGYEIEIWDVLRDTRHKNMATYAEICEGIKKGSLIRIK